MVDWATQNRLYPPGYRPVDIRYRRTSIDKSLPFAVGPFPKHHCGIRRSSSKFDPESVSERRDLLGQAFEFHKNLSKPDDDQRTPKLLATYTSKINWPRSVCCLSETDGSLVVCEQDRCVLLLFTSQLMFRSSCGGRRGNGIFEFDSPWSVTSLFDKTMSNIVVADTNNRRLQHFVIGQNGRFLFKNSFQTNEKPFYVTSSENYFAASCERALIVCYSSKEKTLRTEIDLNKSRLIKKNTTQALPICMDCETSFIFVCDLTSPISRILQLTITGGYLREILLDRHPFIRISSLIFDRIDQQLIGLDSSNSLVCSIDQDLDDDNTEILLKSSDQLYSPQSLCLANEGHLIIVECSVTSEHSLKIFRHHPCLCHTRITSSSVKTSETTSVRSMYFPF